MKKEPRLITFGVEGGRIFLRFPYMDECGEWTHSDNFMDGGVAFRLIEELAACLSETSNGTVIVQVVGVHAQDCAVALNPRHECSCRRSPIKN